jgi:rhombotail lipoprotein
MHRLLRWNGPRTRRAACLLGFALTGCALLGPNPGAHHSAASVVDFLYPDQKEQVVAPAIPRLNLPLRVGIAFVPGSAAATRAALPPRSDAGAPFAAQGAGALTEKARLDLMQRIAEHFRAAPFVRSIEIIPSPYLRPQGGFANLDELRAFYGIDVIALVSYDQVQFTDRGAWSLTYWTLVGAYVVPAEHNDTQTLLDTVVFDIPSRKMLFRAPGTDRVTGRATLVNVTEQLRVDSANSFDAAVQQMIVGLDQQLALFRARIKQHPEEAQVVRTAQ